MHKMVARGIPILLLSLLLAGVGGGISFAADDDPVQRLLELRLHTEQAIAQMRSEGDRTLADEMERQLPGALAEVADRISAAMPELPVMEPRVAEAAVAQKEHLQHDPVAARLAQLATFDGTHGNGVYDQLPVTLTYEEKVLARYEHQVAMTQSHMDKLDEKLGMKLASLGDKFSHDALKLADKQLKVAAHAEKQLAKADEKLAKIEEKKDEKLAKVEPPAPEPVPDPAPAPEPAPVPTPEDDKKDKGK